MRKALVVLAVLTFALLAGCSKAPPAGKLAVGSFALSLQGNVDLKYTAFSNGGKDITHHDNYGAYELAKFIVQGIRDAKLPLAQFITEDFTGFDPAKPDSPDTFVFAASPGRSNVIPRGN